MKFSVKNGALQVTGSLDRFNLGKNSLRHFPDLNGTVTVDLSGIDVIDTAGLAWLLKLVSYYQTHNEEVCLAAPSEQLISLAKVSNVLALLPFKD